MRPIIGAISITTLFCCQVFGDSTSATRPNYNVNRVGDAAPVIDGVVSPGEWDAASSAAGNWVDLRPNTPDTHNLRFQMLWDDSNLYILTLSDYDNIPEPVEGLGETHDPDPDYDEEIFDGFPNNPNWNGNADSYNSNYYFDPNTDGEALWEDPENAHPSVDGYQFTWDVRTGFNARRPTEGDPDRSLRDPRDADGNQINDYFSGIFLEGHANAAFGNQGLFDLSNDGPNENYRDDNHPGLTWAQNADNADVNGTAAAGMVQEIAISWDTFNATNPNRLVTQAEAEARPELVVDTREFLTVPDPDPDAEPGETIEIENPDFDMEVPNVGQVPGTGAFIGNEGEPDLRFSDPDSPVFIDNGLYAVDGPSAGDVWAFEASFITNEGANLIPTWAEVLEGPRGPSIAPWGATGHGAITFIGDEVGCAVPDGLVAGDFDGVDGVAFADFLILSGNFGNEVQSYADGDADCSGTVDFADFLLLSGNFGTGVAAAQSVPEPSSILMLLAGLIGIASVRRRR